MGFKENLKAELLYANMRVKELATLSGVKKQTIDSYLRERGYIPSAEAAVHIAQALGISVEYLVTGKDTRRGKTVSALSPELRMLIKVLEQLTEGERHIVVKNALYLVEILKEETRVKTRR